MSNGDRERGERERNMYYGGVTECTKKEGTYSQHHDVDVILFATFSVLHV